MSNTDPDANESIDPRTERALTECMTVLPEGGDIFTVVGENGGTYTVDSREGRCTCPDHKHRGVTCKHQRRVAVATAERGVPAGGDDVDEQLGAHTEATPRVVASDGGEVLEAGDGEGEAAERPADCTCWNVDAELPCWPCYRDGFRSQNPDEPGAEE